jgi:ABC-type Mn2+/Zn2+ transport system permease subunit
MPILAWLVEPFRYEFMLRGLAAGLLVGVVCPVLGTYVVLRGMAFLGDALAHIILPGVVAAQLFGGPLAAGALVAGVLAALGIGAMSRRRDIKEDTAIGVVFAGAFALGVAMLSGQRSYAVDLAHILFGNLLGVTSSDLWLSASLAVLVLGAVVALHKELLIITFDPLLASTLRLPAGVLHYLLLILMAAVIVISIQAVGVALVLAMLVTPAAAARLLARSVDGMMAGAVAIGLLSVLAGLYASYYWNLTSGPAIVLAQTAVFAVVFFAAPRIKGGRARRGRGEPPAEMSQAPAMR